MNGAAQRLAIPAYFPPGPYWRQMQCAAPVVGIAVVNPASGPGMAADPAYAATIAASRAAGIAICGYVDTNRTARDPAAVRADIDRYFAWYPVDGIFLDQASTSAEAIPYYGALAKHIRACATEARVILNPGTATNEGYFAVADIIVTFEDTYRAYTTNYHAAPWQRQYPPERFWHLVHTTRTIRQMRHAVALCKERGAEYMYITPGSMPNPWGRLPGHPYWRAVTDS